MSPVHPPSQSRWNGLRVTLLRCQKGPPLGRHGWYHGVVFTVFHLLEGTVRMAKERNEATAGPGQWIVCQPGKRYQHFSDSARILSIHLLIESPSNAASWIGRQLLTLDTDRTLERRSRELHETPILQRLRKHGKLTPQSEAATFTEMITLQRTTSAFFGRLLDLLEPRGMRYEAPSIRDSRVRDTRLHLASCGLREKFSRVSLARSCGLSAAQLDRLWRQELGITPAHYWNRRRVETASALLLEVDRPIKEVAYETGFDHAGQFSTWFTQNLKESPRAFRARHERD